MPYADQWGITITRTGAGVYAVSRLGVSGTVRIDETFAITQESINQAAALFRACEFMAIERDGVGDGDLARLWRLRARYALVRWKILAYDRKISLASGQVRAALQAKRTPLDGQRADLESDPELDE